jgi:hypothetical protein
MDREALIRANCLAADLRAFLDGYGSWTSKELDQWQSDLEDNLEHLERELEKASD